MKDLTQVAKANADEIAKYRKWQSDIKDRAEIMGVVTAACLIEAVGQDQAMDFLSNKIATLNDGEVRFLGPDGLEAARMHSADGVDTGWALTKAGAYFAVKAQRGEDNIAIVLEPSQMAALAVELIEGLQHFVDKSSQTALANDGEPRFAHITSDILKDYHGMLDHLASQHLWVNGKAQEIYRAAKYQAQLTVEAHAKAAEGIAEEKAMKKVEGLVRKLSQAAAMPSGLEKSLMLEEAAPMIRKAFGGE